MAPNHALVFGASGISGWAITKALAEGYPTKDTFESITALTNRPLSREDALWPATSKLDIVSGIDILTEAGQDAFEAELKEKVKNISSITHVYFYAYIMSEDSAKEVSTNEELIKRAVTAVENLSPSLKYVVLPTGTKAYGVMLLDKFPFPKDLPLSEKLPRIPEPWRSQMFYYSQVDALAAMGQGKKWTWCEIIPDVVVGFVPNNNVYCMAQVLSTYLSLYAEVNGKGSDVAFPGTELSWKALSNDSSQDIVAKASIIASLRPEKSAEQRYNTADDPAPSSWSQKWPIVCDYFGLKGVGPSPSGPQPTEYCADHLDEWKAMEEKYGLKKGRVGNDRSFGGFPYLIMTLFDFDRNLDVSKVQDMMGDYKVEGDTKSVWYTAFDRFREAKIIP
ncbi:hypothetical protein F5Y18DRAFT_417396 [Xylariaceae sp. FL1019]|nr:hypothetical protein F5Y18DRAFT_417396 [Xylariaceae sp. FL1019]